MSEKTRSTEEVNYYPVFVFKFPKVEGKTQETTIELNYFFRTDRLGPTTWIPYLFSSDESWDPRKDTDYTEKEQRLIKYVKQVDNRVGYPLYPQKRYRLRTDYDDKRNITLFLEDTESSIEVALETPSDEAAKELKLLSKVLMTPILSTD